MRVIVLLGLVVMALLAMLWGRPQGLGGGEPPRLAYAATAHQLGPVGYRDPAGALSPDGSRLAYSEGRHIRVVPVAGGPPVTLPPGRAQVRSLTWVSEMHLVAEAPGDEFRWWSYRFADSGVSRTPLWQDAPGLSPSDLRQLAWSRDGARAVATASTPDGPQLLRLSAEGSIEERRSLDGRLSAPAFTPSGEIACVSSDSGRPRLSLPCGEATRRFQPDVDVVGPLVFAPGGGLVYFASPNPQGTVDLWVGDRVSGHARRLAGFARDAYPTSVAVDGTLLFASQSYRTFVADVGASGGPTRQLTRFQAETPSWHPTRPLVAFTFGTWRRVLDDANYPDIAQEIGALDLGAPLPSAQPSAVIAASSSEDQGMAWSPSGVWIAFHSHREGSDDIWLRRADGQGRDHRVTFLGRGAEVGWPRWSPDGRTLLFTGARKDGRRSVIYTVDLDPATGDARADSREVRVEGLDADVVHAEWLPSGATAIALVREAPGRQAIVTVPLTGGRPFVVHRWESEHDSAGLGVSPDGRWAAFIAPAPDGFFQVFKVPVGGGALIQVTTDRSHKTQPAWSPDGARIAFAVWGYDMAFWTTR